MHALGDVVAFPQGQAAAHGGAGAGRPLGIQGVDVEGEVDGGVVADVSEGHFHDSADTVSGEIRLEFEDVFQRDWGGGGVRTYRCRAC